MELGVAVAVLCIAVGGVAAQWVAWKVKVPAIILLFLAGLLIGPVLQVLQPSQSFGPALHPIIGLAVAIVVFEGGLALNMRELRAAGEGVLRLTAVALPINALLGAAVAFLLTPMGWGAAALFGAITVVTGPTVVLPLLRQTRLHRRAAAFLKWEAIVNDPVGAILAAVVLQVLVTGSEASQGQLVLHLALGLVVATALGVGAAFLVRWAFLRDHVPEVLKTPMLLALALGVYALANVVLDDAGLMAATVFGIVLANLDVPGLTELRRFKEALVVLVVSALFIVLTADLSRDVLRQISWPVLALTLVMVLVVRPAAILLATVRSGLSWPERLLPAWIAPRGIVAAAVAGVAGLRLQSAGYQGAEEVMPAVFALIATTMVLHGFSLRPLAHRLNLTLGATPGLAIVGATDWSTQMAVTLQRAGVPVLLIDTFPGALDGARALKLPVLQAELLSEHGREELEGRPVDYLIATTPDEIYNGMVCASLATELGRERVFQLAPAGGRHDLFRGMSRDWRGKVFGEVAIDQRSFERRFARGWRFEVVQADVLPPLDRGRMVVLLTLLESGVLLIRSPEMASDEPGTGVQVLVFAAPGAIAALPDRSEQPAC